MLRKGSETTVHAAGFGLAIRGLRPSDTSEGFFDSLSCPRFSEKEKRGQFFHLSVRQPKLFFCVYGSPFWYSLLAAQWACSSAISRWFTFT